MPRFAANLSLMYTELSFLERFEAAARDGFTAVEFLFPYAWPAAELAARLRANGLQQVLFNAPPGGGEMVPPRSPAAHGALPPEGATPPWERPGGGVMLPPRSPAAHGALPPEGAAPPWEGRN
jgi:hypothetical protein